MLRPLSPLERWYWIADRISPLNVIGRVRVEGHLSVDAARRSLDLLQQRHPLLCTAIRADRGEEPMYVPSNRPIPLRWKCADASHDNTETLWVQEVETEHLARSVNWKTGPLGRAMVFSTAGDHGGDGRHDLILVLHHAIADGTTAVSLSRQWAEIAARITGPHTGQREDAGCRCRELPATEDLFPAAHRSHRGQAAASSKRCRDADNAARLSPERVRRERTVKFEQRRTRLIHRSLDPDTTRALVAACRSHGVTVHGILAAALVAAVHRDAETPQGTYFAIGSPVDFRAELEPAVGPNEAGTYVATLPSLVRCDPNLDIWISAKAVNDDLRARRAAGEHFAMITDLGSRVAMDIDGSRELLRYLDEEGPINLSLSNIGAQELPEAIGGLRITDADFAAGISVTGVLVAAATTSHGRLNWNLTYVDGFVSRGRAARIADDALGTLVAALGPRSGTTAHAAE
ncbi:condensation domain-containing protein [Nocardiopsis rhodophaea]|uniref:Phthiocerol/phthiodiolone dimycocerosyl transferase n=1 Tax=Nocardiopsis rhodophaea TaxID=280238 RepID=A0ABP5EY35_9ACTN